MRIAVGCDHAGFPMKPTVIKALETAGHELVDCGTDSTESVDYPDFAAAVARAVLEGSAERGIVVCGSGVGAAVAANKFQGIRAGLCHDTYSARQGVEHDDVNVLCLGGRIIGPSLCEELVAAFLGARFSAEERHLRRLDKIRKLEDEC